MNTENQYLLALSFWTIAIQYLALVENASREVVKQGNKWFVTRDGKHGEITNEEYSKATRWSDHALIIPLLFNLYHGLELLIKGFLIIAPNQSAKPNHSIIGMRDQFSKVYPSEKELIDLISKYTQEQYLPDLLKNFLTDNNLTLKMMYQSVRYPANQDFQTIKKYRKLKYKGEDGIQFFKELAEDVDLIRRKAVQLSKTFK